MSNLYQRPTIMVELINVEWSQWLQLYVGIVKQNFHIKMVIKKDSDLLYLLSIRPTIQTGDNNLFDDNMVGRYFFVLDKVERGKHTI